VNLVINAAASLERYMEMTKLFFGGYAFLYLKSKSGFV